MQKNDFEYCRNLVKKTFYDLYCLILFLPAQKRDEAIILAAFFMELETIFQKSTSDKMIGYMRFQFWRDAVKQIFEENISREQPVLRCLHALTVEDKTQFSFLETIIDRFELLYESGPLETNADFKDFFEKTYQFLLPNSNLFEEWLCITYTYHQKEQLCQIKEFHLGTNKPVDKIDKILLRDTQYKYKKIQNNIHGTPYLTIWRYLRYRFLF